MPYFIMDIRSRTGRTVWKGIRRTFHCHKMKIQEGGKPGVCPIELCPISKCFRLIIEPDISKNLWGWEASCLRRRQGIADGYLYQRRGWGIFCGGTSVHRPPETKLSLSKTQKSVERRVFLIKIHHTGRICRIAGSFQQRPGMRRLYDSYRSKNIIPNAAIPAAA